jgi:hypothetical protein
MKSLFQFLNRVVLNRLAPAAALSASVNELIAGLSDY